MTMLTPLEERLRANMREVLDELPNFDMPCERTVREQGLDSICGEEPTYLLRRRRQTPSNRTQRILYCADHAVAGAMVWVPVR